MRSCRPRLLPCWLLLCLSASGLLAQEVEAWRQMNQPVEPFRMIGNLYYVGASSVTAFLLVTPEGHIVIDGGFAETAPLIRAGIEQLGFEISDVRILLNSHAHFDHAGGLAQLQAWSGAETAASALDAPLLERGGLDDDLLGDEGPFAPLGIDRRLRDGDTVELGGVVLTANLTAGHTRGCTSWSFEVEEAGETYTAVSICSLSVLDGMKFLEGETYPGIADDFRRSFETLESIDCDIFLASHAEFFDLAGKRARPSAGEAHPFVDPAGYRAYIARARKRFDEAIEAERPGSASAENFVSGGMSALGSLPATFQGTLPCASCPGIDTHLNLAPDGVFFLQRTYRERGDRTFDDIGRWSIGSDGRTLALAGGRKAPIFFSILDDSTLRQLDLDGREIDTAMVHTLKRQSALTDFEPQLAMSGMFRYMADAALFEECLTGRELPVAQEGDYLALERAYLEARAEPGSPVMASLEGAIVSRPPMEGSGEVPMVRVDRFLGLYPDERCGPALVPADLVSPRWELVKLGEEERKLSTAMGATASWRILGRGLELFDAEGASLARFTATEPTGE